MKIIQLLESQTILMSLFKERQTMIKLLLQKIDLNFVLIFVKYVQVFHNDGILEKIVPMKWFLFYFKLLFTIMIVTLNNIIPRINTNHDAIFTLLTKKYEYHG